MMGTVNFTLQDIGGTIAAVGLFPLFLLVPGYVLGWATDLLSFRRRRLITRLLLALALSVAVMPIVTYLLARTGSFVPVWIFYGLSWAGLLVLLVVRARRLRARSIASFFPTSRAVRVALVVGAIWLVAAIVSLVDYQLGDRVYFTVAVHDYAMRVAVTDAISRTGVPPVNPSFYPGHPVELFYYYFWFLVCSLVDLLGGAPVGPRVAAYGGTIWCGAALMAVVALWLRFFRPGDKRGLRTRIVIGVGLLLVTGLDIIPVAGYSLAYFAGGDYFPPTVEWWNDQVTGWVDAALWVPHHIAALVACLLGILLLRAVQRRTDRRGRIVAAVLAGFAFASAVGLSIWIAFVAALFLVVWLLLLLRRGRYGELGLVALSGSVALLLVLPYLFDLLRASHLAVAPIAFTVRRFRIAQAVLFGMGIESAVAHNLVSLAVLPLNYTLELGFFVLAAAAYWSGRLREGEPLGDGEQAEVVLLLTSVLVCSFLRSSVKNNDLGYRGFMFAQFVLLLWAIDPLMALWGRFFRRRLPGGSPDFCLSPRTRRWMRLLLVIGLLSTFYDLVILRLYPIMADRGVVPQLFWMGADRQLGRRTHDLRQAYQAVGEVLPETAVVQHNPAPWIDLPSGLYGERQVVAADYLYGTLFGIPEDDYFALQKMLNPIFISESAWQQVEARCEAFSISALVVKDTDPLWQDESSWLWQREPLFHNEMVRVIPCGGEGGGGDP